MITTGAKDIILKMSEKNKRIDGRGFEDSRNIEINYGISDNAEGSASIKLGDTEVYVGIKLGVGEPYKDSPDKGKLIVTAEVTPIAGSEYEPGPPKDWVIAMARVIDRGVRESGAIDVKKLVIKEGELVWEIFIDVYAINDDGNLISAGGIATAAAIQKTMLPVYDKKKACIDLEKKRTKKLPVISIPIPITFVKIDKVIFVDPNKEEEQASSAQLTVTVNEKDEIVSLQKRGADGFTLAELGKCLKLAVKKSRSIRKILK